MNNKETTFRELLVLRHAKSDGSTDQHDFDRPLKDRGKRNAQQIGNWLREHHLQPQIIISSPALRALTTAEKACKSMGHSVDMIKTDKRLYEADISDLLLLLAEIPDKIQRILLVGHNPALAELLYYLGKVISTPEDGKLLPTATLAQLKIKQPWHSLKAHKAILQALIRPKTLPRLFPYPGKSTTELRQRPAYYYSQSAVIPYRIRQRKIEVLLIRSSGDKHWVVPKGIIEPGLSAVQSAHKEAMEEAGIEGRSDHKTLGQYAYLKWGALCNVEVFAMQVSRELPVTEWPEHHRKRTWVSIDSAIGLVNQTALRPLLKKLQRQLLSCHDS